MKITEQTQDDFVTYRKLDAKIFQLARQCKDSNVPKIEALRFKQDDLIKANRELEDYLTELSYR